MREFNRIIHAQPSVFRINSFSRRISLSWNQALRAISVFLLLNTTLEYVHDIASIIREHRVIIDTDERASEIMPKNSIRVAYSTMQVISHQARKA